MTRLTDHGDIGRRAAIAGLATGLATPAILGARGAGAAERSIRIGVVSPLSGPLAAFGEADAFVLAQVRAAIGAGITVAGAQRPVEIITKDSQSNPSRAADVTADLILRDKVDLLLAASAPDTTNPVADQAEVNEVPCITTDCPWQSYFFGRKGDPASGFDWTYHFFWGLEDALAAYLAMWDTVPTNKVVGVLFPNDSDGNAWGDPKFGFPSVAPKAGYRLVDTGRFQPFASDFTAQISAFRNAGCEIVTGALTPPDFATFWSQARQQGFRPKVVTIAKALLFPSVLQSLGAAGDGLSTEVWWGPSHPFKSGLTGQTPAELCAAFTKATGRPWTQPLGFKHALFEVALDVLRRSARIEPQAIRDAIRSTDYRSVAGPVRWAGGPDAHKPVPNVSKTPLVAGQWRRHGDAFDLLVVENRTAPEIPTGGTLALLS